MRLVTCAIALAGTWLVCSAIFGGGPAQAAESDDSPVMFALSSSTATIDGVLARVGGGVDQALSGAVSTAGPMIDALRVPTRAVVDQLPRITQFVLETVSERPVTTTVASLLPVIHRGLFDTSVFSPLSADPATDCPTLRNDPAFLSDPAVPAVVSPSNSAESPGLAVSVAQHPVPLPATEPSALAPVALSGSGGTASGAAAAGVAAVTTDSAPPVALAAALSRLRDDTLPSSPGFDSDTTPD